MLSLSSSQIDTIRLILSCIVPVMVIVGWVFIRNNSHSFAKRAELNSLATDIHSIIDDMLTLASSYWLSDNEVSNNPRLSSYFFSTKRDRLSYEMKVMYLYQKLTSKSEAIELYELILDQNLLRTLKQSLTLYDKSINGDNSTIFLNIMGSASNLTMELDNKVITGNLKHLDGLNWFNRIVVKDYEWFDRLVVNNAGRKGVLAGLIIMNCYFLLFLIFH